MYRPLQDDMGKDRGCEREREKTSARERERERSHLTLCKTQWWCMYSNPCSVIWMYALMWAGVSTRLVSFMITCGVERQIRPIQLTVNSPYFFLTRCYSRKQNGKIKGNLEKGHRHVANLDLALRSKVEKTWTRGFLTALIPRLWHPARLECPSNICRW